MIDTTTQPNIPYMWALIRAIREETDKLLSQKRDQGSTLIVERETIAVSLHSHEVAGARG